MLFSYTNGSQWIDVTLSVSGTRKSCIYKISIFEPLYCAMNPISLGNTVFISVPVSVRVTGTIGGKGGLGIGANGTVDVICNSPFLEYCVPTAFQFKPGVSVISYAILKNGVAAYVSCGITVKTAVGGSEITTGGMPSSNVCISMYSPFIFPIKTLRVSVHRASSPCNRIFGYRLISAPPIPL
jgi:hypothetical protein